MVTFICLQNKSSLTWEMRFLHLLLWGVEFNTELNTEGKHTRSTKKKNKAKKTFEYKSNQKKSFQWSSPLQMRVPQTLLLWVSWSFRNLDLPAIKNRMVCEEIINVLQSKPGGSRANRVFKICIKQWHSDLQTNPSIAFVSGLGSVFLFIWFLLHIPSILLLLK